MKKITLFFLPFAFITLFSCEKSKVTCVIENDLNYQVEDKKCDREATESQFLGDWTFTRTTETDTLDYLVKIQTTATPYTVRMVTTFGIPQIDFVNYFDLIIFKNVASTITNSFTLEEVDYSLEITNFKIEATSASTATMYYTMNGVSFVDQGTRQIPN